MRKWIIGLSILGAAIAQSPCDAPNYNPNDQAKHTPDPVATGTLAGGHNEPIECTVARVPSDKPNLDKKRYVTIYGCAERKYGPLDLSIFVRDNTSGEVGSHDEPSAGPEVQYVIGYDAGHKVEINAELKPARPGSKQGFLYMSDGPANKKVQAIEGGWKAQITFKTAR
jgi:hypothetical protein